MVSNLDTQNKWDLTKLKIRQIFLKHGKINATKNKTKLDDANAEIAMLDRKIEEILIENKCANKLVAAKSVITDNIKDIREEETDKLIFRSRANWVEKGEKSNKYFLNLIKHNQAKTIIKQIKVGLQNYYNEVDIRKAIDTFYTNLYKKTKTNTKYESKFLANLPKISDKDKTELEKPLTLSELEAALKTCKESAPGPDGIPYKIYKTYWRILGPKLLETWNESLRLGHISTTQKQSVITLLEKKGKDKTKIENLRPISLSNCDIKIITKAIALRTNELLDGILSNTQTGYVPGRNVGNNSRLLEELISEHVKLEKDAYIITLDAKKAFDSVDHEYLLRCLGAYGFPETYINIIKLIYKDLNASVMVNGYTGKRFDIGRSVKQGDALSCALFVIALDPLLRAIDSDVDINGIKINNNQVVKTMSYADDITGLVIDRNSIQKLITLYEQFSTLCGIELNMPKTEIVNIGLPIFSKQYFKINYMGCEYIIVSQKEAKICGIVFSTDREAAYELNVIDKIHKLQNILNLWRQRNLTMEGKNLIVKTHGISQLIYSMQQTGFRKEDIKLAEDIIYKFIWNKRSDSSHAGGRIKKSIMQQSYHKGGLNTPNLFETNLALKLRHIIKAKYSNHPINDMYNKIYVGINFTWQKQGKCNKLYSRIEGNYLKDAILAHEQLWSRMEADLIDNLGDRENKIHVDYYKWLQNHKLEGSIHVNPNQTAMIRKLNRHNVSNLGQLVKAKNVNNNPQIAFELHQLYHTYPRVWLNTLTRSAIDYIGNDTTMMCYGHNKWKADLAVTTKQIKDRLSETNTNKITTQDVLDKYKINATADCNPFVMSRQCVQSTYHKIIQFKLLHKIYPKNRMLHIWGIKDTDKCSSCGEIESLEHVLLHCPIARNTFANLKETLMTDYNIDTNITDIDIILGRKNDPALSNILIAIKCILVKQEDNNKRMLNPNEIRKVIETEKSIDKNIWYNSRKWIRYHEKWNKYEKDNPDMEFDVSITLSQLSQLS